MGACWPAVTKSRWRLCHTLLTWWRCSWWDVQPAWGTSACPSVTWPAHLNRQIFLCQSNLKMPCTSIRKVRLSQAIMGVRSSLLLLNWAFQRTVQAHYMWNDIASMNLPTVCLFVRVQEENWSHHYEYIFLVTGQQQVTSIEFYIPQTFVKEVYASCKDVVAPSTNSRVMSECCIPDVCNYY